MHVGDPRKVTVPYFDSSLFSAEGDVVNDTNLGLLGNSRRRFFSEILPSPSPRPAPASARIEFDGVWFAYKGEDWVLPVPSGFRNSVKIP